MGGQDAWSTVPHRLRHSGFDGDWRVARFELVTAGHRSGSAMLVDPGAPSSIRAIMVRIASDLGPYATYRDPREVLC
jgi:hypothetical protein